MPDHKSSANASFFDTNSAHALIQLVPPQRLINLSCFSEGIVQQGIYHSFFENQIGTLAHDWHKKYFQGGYAGPSPVAPGLAPSSCRPCYSIVDPPSQDGGLLKTRGAVCTPLRSENSRAGVRFLYEAESEDWKNKCHLLNLRSHDGISRFKPDPLEEQIYRPPLCSFDAAPANSQTNIQRPGIRGSELESHIPGELHISLSQMALYDHPLFSPEDRLYAQMRLLYGEYHRHLKLQRGNYMRSRLQILLEAARDKLNGSKPLKAADSTETTSINKLLLDCLQTLESLTLEQQTINELAETLYTTWNQLKGLRQHQKFTSTPAKLVAINVNQAPQSGLNFVQPLAMKALLDFLHDVLGNATRPGMSFSYEYMIFILRRCRRSLVPAVDFVLKLYTTAQLTYDDGGSLPIHEVVRRRHVQQQRLYAVLFINGRRVACTAPQPLSWPTFTIRLEQPLRVKVAKIPQNIELHLWQQRLIFDTNLATVFVPVLGMSSHQDTRHTSASCLIPFNDWLQFTSDSLCWGVSFGVGEDVNVFLRQGCTLLPWNLCQNSTSFRVGQGAWTRGIVASVGWYCCDIRVQDKLFRAVPKSQIRRVAAAFEVRQRQLTGAALVRLNWIIREFVPKPIDFHVIRNVGRKSCSLCSTSKLHDSRRVRGCELSRRLYDSSVLSTRYTTKKSLSVPARHRLLRLRRHRPALITEAVPATNTVTISNASIDVLITHENLRRQRTLRKQAKVEAGIDVKRDIVGSRRDHVLIAFVQQIQDSVTDRARASHTHPFPLAVLVSEGAPLPQLRTRGLVNAALQYTVHRRRTLRPSRHRRITTSSGRDCSLLVQIISAHRTIENGQNLVIEGDNMSRMATRTSGMFVCAGFQEHTRRTMLAIGHSPRWKEILDLPFIPTLGDFSPASLMQVNDCLRLSLFSESCLAPRHNGDLPLSHKFLGDIEIPFTTLYCNGSAEGYLEGSFRLRSPAINIYTHNTEDISSSEASVEVASSAQGPKLVSYIHIAIFLRPPLSIPPKIPCVVSSLEDERLLRYGGNWLRQLRLYLENIHEIVKRPVDGRISKRAIRLFGNNIKGDAVLICRYLRAQRPPDGVNSCAQAARFVSLIPFLEDWKSFGCGSLDIWCTSQEFLDVGAGDWEEHGVLVHNLLLWLRQHEATTDSAPKDLYLVIGSGLPEGDTVYVMQHDRHLLSNKGALLWNPCTGDSFSAGMKQCPLVDIGCIINSQNVYANVQGDTNPHSLSFEIDDSNLWRPFFLHYSGERADCCSMYTCICNPGPSQILRPGSFASIQETQLRYDAPNVIRAEEIQDELSQEIKKSVRYWRMARANHTSFNVDISRRLQNLLPTLEGQKELGRLDEPALLSHKADTLSITQMWDIDIMAFNMPYANTTTIIERLRTMNVHNTAHRDVQFISAVYVHPIIHHVFSVWIYYGRVCPRSTRMNR